MRIFSLALLPLVLGGCQPAEDLPKRAAVSASAFQTGTPEWRGEKFARNRCSDCHAVGPGADSPRREAPTFERIANTPGLTRATLDQWLRDAHNYPEAMYFAIPEEGIADLVAYMLTLQREDYEPPI